MVHVWTVTDLLREAQENDEGDREWVEAIRVLGVRAHDRGDGLAVYVNQDLGHPELGDWQVVSYGSEASQLPVEPEDGSGSLSMPPTTLPDMGGRINWRYQLHAIVPSPQQRAL